MFVGMTEMLRTNARYHQVILESALFSRSVSDGVGDAEHRVHTGAKCRYFLLCRADIGLMLRRRRAQAGTNLGQV